MSEPTSETNKPSTPAQILEQIHGCKIIYPEHKPPFASPQELNLAFVRILKRKNIIGQGPDQIDEEFIGGVLDGVYDYVNSPIITDPFSKLDDPTEAHSLRRFWRDKLLPPDVRQFYQTNQLKVNRISNIAIPLILLNEIFEGQLPELERDAREIIEHISSVITPYSEDKINNTAKYDLLDDNQKISFVQKLDDMIISLMESIKSVS